jgi:hypothetical protein
MKITATFEMPLPEGFEPYMDIIARTHGWSGAQGTSAAGFLCENVCKPQVSSLFRVLIGNALSHYFGLAGQEQVSVILGQYDQLHTVAATVE